jgi:prepilin-type N-terminal cleavage/methylation domain-containing protein
MKRKAFSLIEILVVVSILTLALSFAFPTFSRFSEQLSLNAAAKSLASEIRALQSQAILQSKTLNLDLVNIKLPPGINFSKISRISFASSGFPPPGGSGSLVLQNKFGRTRKIIVSSAGRVRLE